MCNGYSVLKNAVFQAYYIQFHSGLSSILSFVNFSSQAYVERLLKFGFAVVLLQPNWYGRISKIAQDE